MGRRGRLLETVQDGLAVALDPRLADRLGHIPQLALYECLGVRFEYLTNEPALPLGVIAELYRRRWEIKKVFDEIKNKPCECKAWGTSLETQTAQARLIAITHNLLLAYEQHLEQEHGIQNRPDDRRRTQRTTDAQESKPSRRGVP